MINSHIYSRHKSEEITFNWRYIQDNSLEAGREPNIQSIIYNFLKNRLGVDIEREFKLHYIDQGIGGGEVILDGPNTTKKISRDATIEDYKNILENIRSERPIEELKEEYLEE